MVRDELARLIEDALDDDPRTALIACRNLCDEQLPWLERRAVALARRHGLNWAEIGRLTGRSRQAVRQRFESIVPRPAPGPIETPFERSMREHNARFEQLLARARHEDDDPVAW